MHLRKGLLSKIVKRLMESVPRDRFTPRRFELDLLDAALQSNSILCVSALTEKQFLVLMLVKNMRLKLRETNRCVILTENDVFAREICALLTRHTCVNAALLTSETFRKDPLNGQSEADKIFLSSHTVLLCSANLFLEQVARRVASEALLLVIDDCDVLLTDQNSPLLRVVSLLFDDERNARRHRIVSFSEKLLINEYETCERLVDTIVYLEKALHSTVNTASEMLAQLALTQTLEREVPSGHLDKTQPASDVERLAIEMKPREETTASNKEEAAARCSADSASDVNETCTVCEAYVDHTGLFVKFEAKLKETLCMLELLNSGFFEDDSSTETVDAELVDIIKFLRAELSECLQVLYELGPWSCSRVARGLIQKVVVRENEQLEREKQSACEAAALESQSNKLAEANVVNVANDGNEKEPVNGKEAVPEVASSEATVTSSKFTVRKWVLRVCALACNEIEMEYNEYREKNVLSCDDFLRLCSPKVCAIIDWLRKYTPQLDFTIQEASNLGRPDEGADGDEEEEEDEEDERDTEADGSKSARGGFSRRKADDGVGISNGDSSTLAGGPRGETIAARPPPASLLNEEKLACLIIVKRAYVAFALDKLIEELTHWDSSLYFVRMSHLTRTGEERDRNDHGQASTQVGLHSQSSVANGEVVGEGGTTMERIHYEAIRAQLLLKKFWLQKLNGLIVTTQCFEQIYHDLPRSNLIVLFNPSSTYKTYILTKSRLKQTQQAGPSAASRLGQHSAPGTTPTSTPKSNSQSQTKVNYVVLASAHEGGLQTEAFQLYRDIQRELLARYAAIDEPITHADIVAFRAELNARLLRSRPPPLDGTASNSESNQTPPKGDVELCTCVRDKRLRRKRQSAVAQLVEVLALRIENALCLINRYCAKLPSDAFTHLVPKCTTHTCASTSREDGVLYFAVLQLPINSPLKHAIRGPLMSTRKHAQLAVTLQCCRLLLKYGELDELVNFRVIEKYFCSQCIADADFDHLFDFDVDLLAPDENTVPACPVSRRKHEERVNALHTEALDEHLRINQEFNDDDPDDRESGPDSDADCEADADAEPNNSLQTQSTGSEKGAKAAGMSEWLSTVERTGSKSKADCDRQTQASAREHDEQEDVDAARSAKAQFKLQLHRVDHGMSGALSAAGGAVAYRRVPGSKKRAYYRKRIAACLMRRRSLLNASLAQKPQESSENSTETVKTESESETQLFYIYTVQHTLVNPVADERNVRGRKIVAPESVPKLFGLLTSAPLHPKIPAFSIFTRAGEELIRFEMVSDAPHALNARQLERICRFHHFVFNNVLRLVRDSIMLFAPTDADFHMLIVPLCRNVECESESDPTSLANIDIDWPFLDRVEHALALEQTCKLPPRRDSNGVFEFRDADYLDSVVMPSYRNFDQPPYYYVAEILTEMSPRSPFPSVEEFPTFADYYEVRYNCRITNMQQPLLDVDHTTIRLNLLTPRWLNQSGLCLPLSASQTRKAKRESLEQKQLLIPELCFTHPLPAALWRKAVCLPAILYRLNHLLIADELRSRIAREANIGCVSLPNQFQFAKLEFDFPLAAANASADNEHDDESESEPDNELVKEKQAREQRDREQRPQKSDDKERKKRSTKNSGPRKDPRDLAAVRAELAQMDLSDVKGPEVPVWQATSVSANADNEYITGTNAWKTGDIASEPSNTTCESNIPTSAEQVQQVAPNGQDSQKQPETSVSSDVCWHTDDPQAKVFRTEVKLVVEPPVATVQVAHTATTVTSPAETTNVTATAIEQVAVEEEEVLASEDDAEEDTGKARRPSSSDLCVAPNLNFFPEIDLCAYCGPNPADILHALTMSNANDFFNLERLETIGDSMLKFAVTAYLYCTFVRIHEGKLSYLRSKQVSNLHLLKLGLQRGLPECIVSAKFEPNENWLPPLYVVRSKCTAQPCTPALLSSNKSAVKQSDAASNKETEETAVTSPNTSVKETSEATSETDTTACVKTEASEQDSNATQPEALDDGSASTSRADSEQKSAGASSSSFRGRGRGRGRGGRFFRGRGRGRGGARVSFAPNGETDATAGSGSASAPRGGDVAPYFLQVEHSLPDKAIADCVEALIGCYLTSCSEQAALELMSWFGLVVQHDDAPTPNVSRAGQRTIRLRQPPSPLLTHVTNCDVMYNDLLGTIGEFERNIQYTFTDKSYLIQALTHASFYYNTVTDCYQRLEFLGDAILDYVITRHLFEDCRRYSPGILTDLRSALVNNNIFATLAVRWQFHKVFLYLSPQLFVIVDKFIAHLEMARVRRRQLDERVDAMAFELDTTNAAHMSAEKTATGGSNMDHIQLLFPEESIPEDVEIPKALGDIFESVAGAIFLDSGLSLETVWTVYYRLMRSEIQKYSRTIPKAPVRELLEMEPEAARFERPTRTPDGKVKVTVNIVGKRKFVGIGRNYRIAKCAAARRAVTYLKSLQQAVELASRAPKRTAEPQPPPLPVITFAEGINPPRRPHKPTYYS